MTNASIDAREGMTPATELWTGPMAWEGTPMRPAASLTVFPEAATFVRAEAVLTLSETIGPGMTRQTEKIVPALMRLDKLKPVELHMPGLDGQCWTFRAAKKGRKTQWPLHTGPTFPATDPASDSVLSQYTFDRIIVQTVIPAYGSGKHICIEISGD